MVVPLLSTAQEMLLLLLRGNDSGITFTVTGTDAERRGSSRNYYRRKRWNSNRNINLCNSYSDSRSR